MKKLFSRILATLLVCMLLFSFVACSTTLNGTYVANGIVKQSLTFKEDNVVSVSAFGIDVDGTYVIEDGTITITYSLLGFSYDWVKPFEKDGNTITIDGITFVKEG